MTIRFPAFSLLLLLACSCGGFTQNKTGEKGPEGLIFQSGFESNCRVVKNEADADIIGADESLSDHNNWVDDLDEHPDIGDFWLQYQGGDSSMRFAKIVADPTKPGNHVLQFWLDQPNVSGIKGRVQANLYGNWGMKEYYQSVRIFLPDDFLNVRTYPHKIDWLTISENWNNRAWDRSVPFAFRITLGIGKPDSTVSDLFFILDGQDCVLQPDNSQKYTTIWSETNAKVKVPIGKWFTMEYYFREGNKYNGRYYMAITPEGENRQVVFDVTNFTHNTTDPAPDGLSDVNPMKLYTSKELIDYMHSKGKTLQIFWDDLRIWTDKRPR